MVLKVSIRWSPRAMLLTGGLAEGCLAVVCNRGHRLSGSSLRNVSGLLQGSRMVLTCVSLKGTCGDWCVCI